MKEIEAIKARLAARTQGKWTVAPKPESRFCYVMSDKSPLFVAEEMILPVADFIAHAPTDIATLIEALEAKHTADSGRVSCMYLGGDCCGMLHWYDDGKVACNECGREVIIMENKQ